MKILNAKINFLQISPKIINLIIRLQLSPTDVPSYLFPKDNSKISSLYLRIFIQVSIYIQLLDDVDQSPKIAKHSFIAPDSVVCFAPATSQTLTMLLSCFLAYFEKVSSIFFLSSTQRILCTIQCFGSMKKIFNSILQLTFVRVSQVHFLMTIQNDLKLYNGDFIHMVFTLHLPISATICIFCLCLDNIYDKKPTNY